MKKNIFAVCDLEVDYAFNFMDYLNQKKKIRDAGVHIYEHLPRRKVSLPTEKKIILSCC